MQAIVPHTLMCLTELDLRSDTIVITASAGDADIEPPTGPTKLTKAEMLRRGVFEIRLHIQKETSRPDQRRRPVACLRPPSHARGPAGVAVGGRGGGRRL